ncbi:hypothetical protein SAMN06265171_10564 [Chryseobacterium rhizoplanae]|uniref:Uncharacterized protein n=1 Tax=Chryseobacterium rhizoplanae TaxID=1609531 RepID=A0A521DF95_9FLAO|nr:hypothetical protein [Chryseobacterium rhizoplanae]SMO70363.1 hypothetical protein SAMN06265171_10564 [Chryseobacterium rhizoplanae]
MKVFSTKFLELPQSEKLKDPNSWSWEPSNKDIKKIYASGAKTATRSSTYASERDNEADTDRPNEGA